MGKKIRRTGIEIFISTTYGLQAIRSVNTASSPNNDKNRNNPFCTIDLGKRVELSTSKFVYIPLTPEVDHTISICEWGRDPHHSKDFNVKLEKGQIKYFVYGQGIFNPIKEIKSKKHFSNRYYTKMTIIMVMIAIILFGVVITIMLLGI